jgi:hypothetical protein
MAWLLWVADIPSSWKRFDNRPKDWRPPTIGSPAELIEKIRRLVPGAVFPDSKNGIVVHSDYSVEIELIGNDENITMLALSIEGSEEAVRFASDFVTGLGLRAFDVASPHIFPGPDPAEGLRLSQWIDQYDDTDEDDGT